MGEKCEAALQVLLHSSSEKINGKISKYIRNDERKKNGV